MRCCNRPLRCRWRRHRLCLSSVVLSVWVYWCASSLSVRPCVAVFLLATPHAAQEDAPAAPAAASSSSSNAAAGAAAAAPAGAAPAVRCRAAVSPLWVTMRSACVYGRFVPPQVSGEEIADVLKDPDFIASLLDSAGVKQDDMEVLSLSLCQPVLLSVSVSLFSCMSVHLFCCLSVRLFCCLSPLFVHGCVRVCVRACTCLVQLDDLLGNKPKDGSDKPKDGGDKGKDASAPK